MDSNILLNYLLSPSYKPQTSSEIADNFNVSTVAQFRQFFLLIADLEAQGLIFTIGGKIYHKDKMSSTGITVTARRIHKSFATDKEGKSYTIPNEYLNGAIYLDEVILESIGNDNYRVERILKRNLLSVVGEVISMNGMIVPDNDNIGLNIYLTNYSSLRIGQKVEVKITQIKPSHFQGELIRVIGHKNDPEVDVLSKIIAHGVNYIFPENVLEEARKIDSTINLKDRIDLTDKIVFTIDGEDAKDLDDAITLEKSEKGTNLYVHIADVSHYVKNNDIIDNEAYKRGTSIYLAGKVIPMLPEELSNGICSLHPNEPRYTITAQMNFDESGNLMEYDIYPSVINSRYRLTYTQVNRLFKGDHFGYDDQLRGILLHARMLASTLRKKRNRRGSLDLVSNEAKIIIENNVVVDVLKRVQDEAEALIEEFMIVANETVASHINRLELPFIYRVHDRIDESKAGYLSKVLIAFNYRLNLEKNVSISSSQLQKVLHYFVGKNEEMVINSLLLRSLAKAKYSITNIGHFGLASKCYTHFTSPIRRYPDLLVHRLLHLYLFNEYDYKKSPSLIPMINDIAENSSLLERKAIALEREVEAMKKAQFMADKVGQVFEGIVCGITNFGIFVELDNTIQGLVHFSALDDDYYHYNENRMEAVGNYRKKVIKIGDKMEVKLLKVDVNTGTIDFVRVSYGRN